MNAMEQPVFKVGAYGEPQLLLLALLAYGKEVSGEISRVHGNFQRLSLSDHQWLGGSFQLAESLKDGVSVNQAFFHGLVRQRALVPSLEVTTFPDSLAPDELLSSSARVRQLLAALAREWTLAGSVEREQCFGFVCNLMRKYCPAQETILIPGASIGRLAHELAALGHSVTAVEDDLLKALAFKYLESKLTSDICPYVLNTCNRLEPNDHAIKLRIPDNSEIVNYPVNYVSDDFFAWATEDEKRKFGAVVTSFFIDACDTPIVQLCRILHLQLNAGGVWANLGSLSYSYEGEVRREDRVYQASAEEVLLAVSKCGFEVLEHGFVKTSYCRKL